jgi:hypothetical protein
MEKMTAKEAAKLSKENNSEVIVENILKSVEKAAKDGAFEIKVREYGFNSSAHYGATDNFPTKTKEVIKELRQLGYRADIKTNEGQFVDLYLSVSWRQ